MSLPQCHSWALQTEDNTRKNVTLGCSSIRLQTTDFQLQGTRTGAKPQWQPGAANPESAHNTHRTTAQEQVPSNTSRRPDGRVRARRVPSPYRLITAAVRMDECAPGVYPAPTGYEQAQSGWTSACPEGTQPLPATNSRPPDGRVSAPQRRPAHATPHPQPKAQHTERAHRCTRAKRPRTPYTQHNPTSGRTGEQEPRGPGHRTRKTTHRAGTPVNRSQGARDTAQAKQRTQDPPGEIPNFRLTDYNKIFS